MRRMSLALIHICALNLSKDRIMDIFLLTKLRKGNKWCKEVADINSVKLKEEIKKAGYTPVSYTHLTAKGM